MSILRILLVGLISTMSASAPSVGGQAEPQKAGSQRLRYANRPDALFPYSNVRIYKDVYATRQEFLGAGRDTPEPRVATVRIGFIGPLTEEDRPSLPPDLRPVPTSPNKTLFGRHLLNGATLAVEEANLNGGYRGQPFEIVRRTDLVQWGQTSNELAQFAYNDKVWAIISSLDSNHNHVLNRAALKAQVPLVNVGSTDPTLTEHNIPWLVRCINDDRLNAFELLYHAYRTRDYRRVAVLRVNDRDGRVGVAEFMKGARRLGRPVLIELRFPDGAVDFSSQLETIRRLRAEAVVVWGNPQEAALIVRQMAEREMEPEVLGFDRMANRLFLELAGDHAEKVVVAASMNPDGEGSLWKSFREAYSERFGEEPEAFAAHGYDGMRLIIESIRKAGLNRVLIRDALYDLKTFPGATGEIIFDETMNDISRPWLAVVEEGQFRYMRPPDWERKEDLEVTIESAPTGPAPPAQDGDRQ